MNVVKKIWKSIKLGSATLYCFTVVTRHYIQMKWTNNLKENSLNNNRLSFNVTKQNKNLIYSYKRKMIKYLNIFGRRKQETSFANKEYHMSKSKKKREEDTAI